MAHKVIISCAITGSIHTPSMSPYLPVTAQEIADSALGAAEARARDDRVAVADELEMRGVRAQGRLDRVGERALVGRDARDVAQRRGERDDVVEEVGGQGLGGQGLGVQRLGVDRLRVHRHEPSSRRG